MEQNWGKKEVEKILEELRLKGEYQTRSEIKRTIRDQDKDLVKMHSQFVFIGIMCITSLVGMFARRITTKLLTEHFGN